VFGKVLGEDMRQLLLVLTFLGGLFAYAAPAMGQAPVTSPTGQKDAGPNGMPPTGVGLLPPAYQEGPIAPAALQLPQQETPPKLHANIDDLQAQLVAALAAQKDEKNPDLKKRVELLQKQIEVQQQMLKLLFDHVKKQPLAGSVTEKLQEQVATMDARSKQAAQRDQELANGLDNITENLDTVRRDSYIPAPLRELFVPSGTNETQLSIYGALAFGYSHILGNSATSAMGATGRRPSTPGGFYFGEFTPDFLLKLNDWIFLEAEIGIGSNGAVAAGSFAQADFFVNDWLTIIAGRFVAPIGFYNERLNNPWINKLPGDVPGAGPPLWQQVLPPMALMGVQATGAFYLGKSPLKLEYAAYISNGLNVAPAGAGGIPNINELANLENMTNTFNIITNEKAAGGRLALWWPALGLEAGVSGMYNGDFLDSRPALGSSGAFENSISLWAVDLNYHKGNWDARFEYGATYQQAKNFIGTNIRRQGLYAQLAYRPWDLPPGFFQKLEFIYRYSFVEFSGINPTALDLSSFSTPMDVPVRRQQNELGVNYWLYPRMVIKFAYQINDEPGFHLHDNQFVTELAWGW
jgi:hypothetical protein